MISVYERQRDESVAEMLTEFCLLYPIFQQEVLDVKQVTTVKRRKRSMVKSSASSISLLQTQCGCWW